MDLHVIRVVHTFPGPGPKFTTFVAIDTGRSVIVRFLFTNPAGNGAVLFHIRIGVTFSQCRPSGTIVVSITAGSVLQVGGTFFLNGGADILTTRRTVFGHVVGGADTFTVFFPDRTAGMRIAFLSVLRA